MKLGKFSFNKRCWSFNEGGRFLTLSLMRFGGDNGWCCRLWVHGHTFTVGARQGKPTCSRHYNRVLTRKEVKEAREGIGGA